MPKDGLSAGVVMVSVLASLLTETPVRSDRAMTGEITLSGLVLAARQAGMRRVILPRDDEKDLVDLPRQVRSAPASRW